MASTSAQEKAEAALCKRRTENPIEQNFPQTAIQTDDTGISGTIYVMSFWNGRNQWNQCCDGDCSGVDFAWLLCDPAGADDTCF